MKCFSTPSWPGRRGPIGTVKAAATPASEVDMPDFSVKAASTTKPAARKRNGASRHSEQADQRDQRSGRRRPAPRRAHGR